MLDARPIPSSAPRIAYVNGEAQSGMWPYEVTADFAQTLTRQFSFREPAWVLYGHDNPIRPGSCVLRMFFMRDGRAMPSNCFLSALTRDDVEAKLGLGRFGVDVPSAGELPGALLIFWPKVMA